MAFDMTGLPSGGGPRSEINVTPLVDVVLVLLIIFMVVTPLLQMGYDVTVPPKAEVLNPTPQQDQIIVSVTADKRVYLNKEYVPLEQLPIRLGTALKNRSKTTVFFSADDRVVYGDAVHVLDLIRNAGAKHIGIIEEYVDPTAAAPLM
jgi:biopolymer transport protein TolR